MNSKIEHPCFTSSISKYLLSAVLIFVLAGCSSFFSEQDPSIRETQIELNVQQTLAALKSTQQNSTGITGDQEITLQAQSATETQEAVFSVPTPGSISPLLTSTPEEPLAEQTAVPENPTPGTAEGFENWMKSANILLYEDIASNPNTNPYIKDTLKEMGIVCSRNGDLPCRDVGNAQGWFRDALGSGSINGAPWDLIIVASENKNGVIELKSSLPGDFYDLILSSIEKGIPAILEVGDLDRSYSNSGRELLAKCGVAFGSNWVRVPPSRRVMFPLVADHPLMQEPNSNLSFSDVTNEWTEVEKGQYYDIGDLLELVPRSDATLLLGTTRDDPDSYGTLASCMDGMLVLQTFSSHQLTYNSMKLIWENYIYNQLKRRFTNSP